MRSAIKNEHYLFDQSHFVFDQSVFNIQPIVETDRAVMGLCYNIIKQHSHNIYANDIFEWAEKLANFDKRLYPAQVLFACFVFAELGLLQISGLTDPTISVISDKKCELNNSKFYNEF